MSTGTHLPQPASNFSKSSMPVFWGAFKQSTRSGLIWVIPASIRSRLVARFPRLPLAPYSLGDAGARFDGSSWERWYSQKDPYCLGSSDYEHEKYERTLSTIGQGPFTRVLEVGCSVGVFTEMLAPRCKELIATDISQNAIRQAQARLWSYPQVKCERRTLPAEMPEGQFDLIICSDVLYYWPVNHLRTALHVFETALVPGGQLLAVHYKAMPEKGAALDGNAVHDFLASTSTLDLVERCTHEKYRIDRYRKPRI